MTAVVGVRRGSLDTGDSTSDAWFADFIQRCSYGQKWQRVLSERLTVPSASLAEHWRAENYAADTRALVAILRADRGRGTATNGDIPTGSVAAAERLLRAVTNHHEGNHLT